MAETLVVNEIYLSLQGESTFAGLPCIFVRLTACDLRCSYCDTAYAFSEGRKMEMGEVLSQVRGLAQPFTERSKVQSPSSFAKASADEKSNVEPRESTVRSPQSTATDGQRSLVLPLVELTGGEPLLQKNSLSLMKMLCDDGFTVLLETSGAHDISRVDFRVRRIMDLKCPSSGESARNRSENLAHLKPTDEIKFVIGTREDYEWAKQQIAEHNLAASCPLLFSWVHPLSASQQDKSLKPVPAGQTAISRQELAEKIIADALPVRFQAQLHKIIWPAEKRGV
ncbi:MAG: 7-carboxy-7-deazaguanine synthase [Verrucomicrobia bacterium]|nr:MAG: 7-carboxy-7-deazaguanine synthase [Verrucomicrobiota bacterium]